jgi:hypothetical protein
MPEQERADGEDNGDSKDDKSRTAIKQRKQSEEELRG